MCDDCYEKDNRCGTSASVLWPHLFRRSDAGLDIFLATYAAKCSTRSGQSVCIQPARVDCLSNLPRAPACLSAAMDERNFGRLGYELIFESQIGRGYDEIAD